MKRILLLIFVFILVFSLIACGSDNAAVKEAKREVRILVARIQEELNPILAAGYTLKTGKKYIKFPEKELYNIWKEN